MQLSPSLRFLVYLFVITLTLAFTLPGSAGSATNTKSSHAKEPVVSPQSSCPAQSSPQTYGSWSSVLDWSGVPGIGTNRTGTGYAVAIHTHLLPNGKVLFWGNIPDAGAIYTWTYNPALNDATQQPLPSAAPTPPVQSSPPNNIFCAGHSFLSDGRLLATGGYIGYRVGNAYANIYNYSTNNWTTAPAMVTARWYPTQTIMKDGETFVMAGVYTAGIQKAQILQANDTWRTLNQQDIYDIYPWLYSAPDGRVFMAGPENRTGYTDTTAGTFSSDWKYTNDASTTRDYGSSVMYDNGKILILGGGAVPASGNQPTDTAETIDLQDAPTWNNKVTPGGADMKMNFRRRQHNATVLPDGKVFINGGSSAAGFSEPSGAVTTAEMWNPTSRTFTLMNSECQFRGYHSTSILLPDGRVLSAGTTAQDLSTLTPNAQVYSPPYLFNADGSLATRPVISGELTDPRATGTGHLVTDPNGPPAVVKYGDRITVNLASATTISKVALIRLPSVTHSFNQNGRFSSLKFEQSQNNLGVTVSAPGNAFYSPPGDYMLFLLNAQGVPSIAKIIRIGFTRPQDAHPLNPQGDNNSDEAWFFIQQHYYDFLDREPDQGGWDYWANKIQFCMDNLSQCTCAGAPCDLATRRANISMQFYNSAEFQQTGSFIYRSYKGSLSRYLSFAEFTSDRSRVVGGTDLEASKQAFALDFVQRPEFLSKYPASQDAPTFVDTLRYYVYVTTFGGVDLTDRRSEFINSYNYSDPYGSRARILRLAIDDSRFQNAEFNRGFVLMEYYGYLRRDFDPDGFAFHVNNLDTLTNADRYQNQVKDFITSVEYRRRWGK